jgi:hypothetical protein
MVLPIVQTLRSVKVRFKADIACEECQCVKYRRDGWNY